MNTNELPNYVKLFGDIDFRGADEARSVYSPAAYLVDLLQLIDDQMIFPDEHNRLDQRRADINRILLDSENTFTLLPYLDIVNEVLEEKVKEAAGKDAYESLKLAKYPFNLPFNLNHEQVALYETYLGITPEEFHKAFAQPYDKDVVAREYLGLSEEDVIEIVTKYTGDELRSRYGGYLPIELNERSLNALQEDGLPDKVLEELEALKDKQFYAQEKFLEAVKQKIGEEQTVHHKEAILEHVDMWSTTRMSVDAFLDATGLTHLELRELLVGNLDANEVVKQRQSKFFCNSELDGFATFDVTEENIVWSDNNADPESSSVIPVLWFDRAQRLIRLSRMTDLSISDLNLIIQDCCNNNLKTESLKPIAIVKNLSTTFGLKNDEICALFSAMSDMGHGAADLPTDLFHRVFNGRLASLTKTYVGRHEHIPAQLDKFTQLEYTGDILAVDNKPYRNRIAQGLNISEKQLQIAIRGFRGRDNEDIEDEDNFDRLWVTQDDEMSMLSALYRTSKLVEVLESSFEDLFMLLDILERDPAVRQFANGGVFIDYSVTERNCYQILQQGTTEDLLWLVQLLCSLTKWLTANDLSVEELLKISTGRHRRNLKEVTALSDKKRASAEALATKEKIALLNDLYGQLKPWLLDEESFVSNTFDQRFARILHDVVTQSALVAKADARLVCFHEKALVEAAYEAIDRVDLLTKVDFLGLGLEEKVADKIFANLVLMGYLTPDGMLNESMMPELSSDFSIETDFTFVQEPLFEIIQTLYEEHIDVAIYPSDLQSLDLLQAHLDELYDNLIFNGFLGQDGTLLQGATLSSIDNLDLFEVNSSIGEYSRQVYDLIHAAVGKFEQIKIVIGNDIFSDLPLAEMEAEDLVANLRFNEYIDEDNVLVDHIALLTVKAEDLLLELRFYPQRHGILSALQLHIEQQRGQFYTFKKENFFDIAEQLTADWAFQAIRSEYLQEGRIPEENRDYFRHLENAPSLDIAWPFEPNDNRVVFERVRAIVQVADQYRLTNAPFEALKFDEVEISELIAVLIANGTLTSERRIPADTVHYFLNIDNALAFAVEAFEDYSKDVFFMLHEIAKQVDKATQEITARHNDLAVGQEQILYQSLTEAFGLSAESIAAISQAVFAGSANVRDEWLLPILATTNIYDEIVQEPDSSRFNTAYRRIQQFALLAAKLKLDQDEIEIAFHDQSLVEKYPESIKLPEITKSDGSKEQLTDFDALLESTDGHIYLFKSADGANDYARYWVYSAITHELIETEDNKLSTLLTGDKENAVHISRVEATFVNKQGDDVLIADGRYYVRKKTTNEAKDGSIWQIHERVWGQVDSDFEKLQVIDAAFTDESGRTYLFANEQYVRYSNGLIDDKIKDDKVKDDNGYKDIDDGYPKNIADSWADEGKNQALPTEFQTSLDAAFHGTNNKTYFFNDGQFISADEPEAIQSTREVWGKVKNNLKASQRVDAFYGEGTQVFVLAGDQIFAYRDCLENEGVLIQEGFPKRLVDHFGPSLPGEFHVGVDAVFKGEDGHIHLFKGEKSVAIDVAQSPDDDAPDLVNTKDRWGLIANTLTTSGHVDAVLAGLDGRIYLFSGEQYFRYSNSDYAEVDSGYPRNVREDWGGLTGINAAFVFDGKTYLCGEVKKDDGTTITKAYVRYSTNDYEAPDDGYPKAQEETDDYWWNLPESIRNTNAFQEVNAVFNAPDGKTFLFAGEVFIYFDRGRSWWSEPQRLDEMWKDIPFASVDAAFYGKDGKTYFFSGREYVRFSGDDYRRLDNGYPRPTNRLWGNVKNNIAERGKIDATLVVESREEKEQDDGTHETLKTMHTYLFSGDQFFRYKDADYERVESGYPKTIGLLKDEPRFKNLDGVLDKGLEEGIDAAFSDRRNVYLLKGSTIHVVSDEPCARYLGSDATAFANVSCAFMDQGAVYVVNGDGWHHLSSLEGRDSNLEDQDIALTAEMPPLLTDIPNNYKSGLNAVLQGTDTNTYLFKGNAFFNLGLNREFPITEQWGRVRNNIQNRNTIDAGFVGRDGKTYLFSGDQYVVYEGPTYIGKEVFKGSAHTSAVKLIADNWGGLTSVHVAYVMQDQTYLFEKPDATGKFRYVRYSTTDYKRPDIGFPQVADDEFWQIPHEYQAQGWDSFDVIVIENDETMLFIKGQEFLQFNAASEHWSHPKSLDTLWPGIHQDNRLFDNLQTALIGVDGTAYFFGDECYVTHKDGVFTERKPIGDDWGMLPTPFKEKIDAAFVHRNTVTYLFAGDHYIRYSGTDYCNVDDGYPKLITQELRREPGFENLPPEFEVRAAELNIGADAVIVNAVVANNRNIYLFMGADCYISSSSKTDIYDIDILGNQRNNLYTTGEADTAFVSADSLGVKRTYLFSGDQYVRYSESNVHTVDYAYVDDGYPKRISTALATELSADSALSIPPQFHAGIDAALSAENGTVYLFKDDLFFSTKKAEAQEIQKTWGKAQNNFAPTTTDVSKDDVSIDGAFVDAMGRLYAFKGDQFIRYADTDQEYVETGYPKRLAATFQVPDSFTNPDDDKVTIDAAFTFEGHTYLVKGDEYVRYIGEDYGSLPGFYPVKFSDRWGNWSDYRLEDIKLITRFKSLQESYGGDHTLVDFLRINQGSVKHPYAMLADIFNWDVEEVKWLKRNNAFLPPTAESETHFNLELICRIFDILSLCAKMAAGAKSAYEDIWQKRYGTEPNLAEAADALLGLLGAKNGNSSDWQVLVDEVHNKLNLLKRDALVPYTIFSDAEVHDARDLYEQLLLDVQMGESGQISRIKEAIAAVQLYFHRYFINLEDVDLKGTYDDIRKGDIQKEILKERWRWMRNYRVWEANRKVFLYPENYIRPELRDSKTPEFKTLEENLLQGELTEENITRAFNHYINRYMEVSRLTIAGGYVYDSIANEDDKQIILFGRTKSEPHQYYYRTATFVNGQSDAVAWQPWLAVNVQIEADRVYPVFALNRIFVFWAKVEVRSNVGADTKLSVKENESSGFTSETDAVNESVLQIYYAYFNLNGEWTPPQKIQYEITSNDTITEFFLDFSGVREEADKDLDNIQIRCHYTTERQIKPEAEDDGVVIVNALLEQINGKDNTTDTTVYLKASDPNGTYYVEKREGKIYVNRLLPGDTLGAGAQFTVSNSEEKLSFTANIKAEESDPPLETEESDLLADVTVVKGIIGDGYSLRPGDATTEILYFQEPGNEIMKSEWGDLTTLAAQRHATFCFITNRQEMDNTFRFYPQTNIASEESHNTAIQGILQSGIDTFQTLFPHEDATQIKRPVLLNGSSDQDSLPWVCFDYKGGSFLCKPQIPPSQEGELRELLSLPASFTQISAIFRADSKTYFFSKDGQYIIMDDQDNGQNEVRSAKDFSGKIENYIQRDGQVDAALVWDDQTFLFRGDQYVVYSHTTDGGSSEYVDESYPRRLADNTDNLPNIETLGWEQIDASFQAGTTSYFVSGTEYVTSDDLANKKNISDKWRTQGIPPSSEIHSVFTYEDNTYSTYILEDDSRGWFKESSEDDLKARLNQLYNKVNSSDIPFAEVKSAFAIGKAVYMKVEDGPIKYMRYERESSSSVFVAENHLYILSNPEDNTNPVIRRWNTKNLSDDPQSIEIDDAPDEGVDTFFYDGKNTYILSLRGDEYMILEGLPDQSTDEIEWEDEGDIDEFIETLEFVAPVSKIDAGFNKDGIVFIISGAYYLRFSDPAELTDPDEGYPKLLSEGAHDRLPSWESIDAAFQGPDNIVRFFHGKEHIHNGKDGDFSSPAQIKETWGKVKNNIQESGEVDAAFKTNDHVYLISGDQYYRYATDQFELPTLDLSNFEPELEEGYPKRLANNGEGLPWQEGKRITAAFGMDEKIYLFYDDGVIYAEFDPATKKHTEGRIGTDWQWPKAYRNFDAAYRDDQCLYLIRGATYRKYAFLKAAQLYRHNAQYDIIRLSSMSGSKLSQALFADGINALMKPAIQEIDEVPTFTLEQSTNTTQASNSQTDTIQTDTTQTVDAIIRANPAKVSHEIFPVNSHLEFRGANGLYYWELFYHVPALIAQSLNAAQKFEEAKRWYEYIFDPTVGSQYWKFLPFLAVDIDALVATIALWKEDNGDIARATTALIDKLMPFAPALSGQESMDEAQIREFDKLSEWDDKGNFTTWDEVKLLEDHLKDRQVTIDNQETQTADDKKTLTDIATTQEALVLIKRLPMRYALMINNGPEQIKTYLDDPFDPHAIAALRRIAYRRTTVMAYIDNLLDWGDMLFRQYTHESINEARMLYILAYDLLGKKPSSLGTKVLSADSTFESFRNKGAEANENAYDFLFDVANDGSRVKSLTHAGVVHESVGNSYFYIPENEQILGYWERVEDRLYKIRHSLNIMGIAQPLPLFQPPIDPMSIVRAVAGGGGVGAALAGLQATVPHYRFTFMLNKARELVGKLSHFGNELLGAIEKQDAETLSLLQNRQEGVILQMTHAIKEAQLREAEENLKHLERSKASAAIQQAHYADLISTGMILEEYIQIGLMLEAGRVFALIPVLKIAAAIAKVLPEIKIGAPPTMGTSIGGSALGGFLNFVAESGESIAEALSMVGEAAGIVAQHKRSVEDWELQEQMATGEIEQLEYQIAGAQWQIRAAEHELAVHEKETEHNQSINTFMQEKFSNQQLYQWMAGKLSALYFQTYKMAHDMAKAAEMAYRFERGVPESQVNFIGGSYWDSLRKGLLAGDSLGLDLDRMEKAYLETNARGFEITKTISLVELDPIAFLELKSKGVCEFHFSEELFDYDFPGHYRRQVKTIALKLNAGEGKTVNATLTQLRNKTVMEPDAKAVKYLLDPKESQPLTIRNDWRPSQQIAVSQIDSYTENSSGLFELRFDDERYLPFEGTGAISSWRLELSGKRGSYNISELADAEIELKYTAHQGGQLFADAVKGMLKPYETAVYIDMAQQFPNEFFAFVYDETDELEINVTRDLFPNMAGSKITGIYSFFEVQDEGQISLVMNDDDALTLRSNKLLLTDSLAVGTRGETWTFEAQGQKLDLVNVGLVFGYKALVE